MCILGRVFLETDVDECSEMLDNCDHICINTSGSFVCQCYVGFKLQSDGHTCEGWDRRLNKLVR